jgi:hypothetical protein
MKSTSNPQPCERAAYSIDEWRARYGLGRNIVYSLIATGRLKTSKIGRRRIITITQDRDFRELIEREGEA